MRIIEFIKRNISLLNVVSCILLFCLLFEFITMLPEETYHGLASGILFGFFIINLLILLVDYILRLIFKDKLTLFLIELILLFIISYLIYSTYF